MRYRWLKPRISKMLCTVSLRPARRRSPPLPADLLDGAHHRAQAGARDVGEALAVDHDLEALLLQIAFWIALSNRRTVWALMKPSDRAG